MLRRGPLVVKLVAINTLLLDMTTFLFLADTKMSDEALKSPCDGLSEYVHLVAEYRLVVE